MQPIKHSHLRSCQAPDTIKTRAPSASMASVAPGLRCHAQSTPALCSCSAALCHKKKFALPLTDVFSLTLPSMSSFNEPAVMEAVYGDDWGLVCEDGMADEIWAELAAVVEKYEGRVAVLRAKALAKKRADAEQLTGRKRAFVVQRMLRFNEDWSRDIEPILHEHRVCNEAHETADEVAETTDETDDAIAVSIEYWDNYDDLEHVCEREYRQDEEVKIEFYLRIQTDWDYVLFSVKLTATVEMYRWPSDSCWRFGKCVDTGGRVDEPSLGGFAVDYSVPSCRVEVLERDFVVAYKGWWMKNYEQVKAGLEAYIKEFVEDEAFAVAISGAVDIPLNEKRLVFLANDKNIPLAQYLLGKKLFYDKAMPEAAAWIISAARGDLSDAKILIRSVISISFENLSKMSDEEQISMLSRGLQVSYNQREKLDFN